MNTSLSGGHTGAASARRMLPGVLVGAAILAAPASVITVHYYRSDAREQGWTLWVWNDADESGGTDVEPAGRDEFGLVFQMDRSKFPFPAVGMLPKLGEWVERDEWDRVWTPPMGDEVWIVAEHRELRAERPRIQPRISAARWLDPVSIELTASIVPGPGELTTATVVVADPRAGGELPIASVEPATDSPRRFVVRLADRGELELGAPVEVAAGRFGARALEPGSLLDSPALVPDTPMGAFIDGDRLVVRTWAPTATAIDLVVYDRAEGGAGAATSMTRGPAGSWGIERPAPAGPIYYMFRVTHPHRDGARTREVSDPWARAVVDSHGRGIVVPAQEPPSPGPRFPPMESIIYEIHLRDLTVDPRSGVERPGTYLGAAERGTTIDSAGKVATGLDHIREMGVNVVQIMPVHEFEGDARGYNWGYKTSHFWAPERGYAAGDDPLAPVRELKTLVRAFHDAGIKVVLDVVFNHTAESDPGILLSFNGLAPHHFYRIRDDGSYWNGSGVGNEVRSETPIARRYILDCMRYWMQEYGVDGFRFDLMGLTDLQTLTEAVAELREIRPDVLIYGEPWGGGHSPVELTGKGAQRTRGFGVFSDDFRNTVRGNPFDYRARGFIQGARNRDDVRTAVRGAIDSFAAGPGEVINYLSCHDNRTLWDRIVASTADDPDLDDVERERMMRLGSAILLTSQGIPFLHAGMEFRRTKGGNDNSYDAGDRVNAMRWADKTAHGDLVEYVRGFVGLRRRHPVFRLETAGEIRRNLAFLDEIGLPMPDGCLGYRLLRGDTDDAWTEALVLLNPTASAASFAVPAGPWTVAADDLRVHGPTDPGRTWIGDRIEVPRRAAMILYR